jgi:hypothetical protein
MEGQVRSIPLFCVDELTSLTPDGNRVRAGIVQLLHSLLRIDDGLLQFSATGGVQQPADLLSQGGHVWRNRSADRG